jgi:hypothetical protein
MTASDTVTEKYTGKANTEAYEKNFTYLTGTP